MRFVLAAIALACAAPALAQQTFQPPAGCKAYLTVQNASCEVEHHFICENDPSGHQRRVTLTEEGMIYAGEIDSETQWIESFHILSGHSERLEPRPAERASLTDLIANGVDDYDFQTLSKEIGATRYVGQDRLTGRKITIDGVTLDETAYRITAFALDGTELWRSEGNEFVSRDWRMFLSGTGTTTINGEVFERDDRPVEFIFPGEPGFLSTNPKHGCGLALS